MGDQELKFMNGGVFKTQATPPYPI